MALAECLQSVGRLLVDCLQSVGRLITDFTTLSFSSRFSIELLRCFTSKYSAGFDILQIILKFKFIEFKFHQPSISLKTVFNVINHSL